MPESGLYGVVDAWPVNGLYVMVGLAYPVLAFAAEAAADEVPDVMPDTAGVLIVGTLGIFSDGVDVLGTVGAAIVGAAISEIFGNFGTAL